MIWKRFGVLGFKVGREYCVLGKYYGKDIKYRYNFVGFFKFRIYR